MKASSLATAGTSKKNHPDENHPNAFHRAFSFPPSDSFTVWKLTGQDDWPILALSLAFFGSDGRQRRPAHKKVPVPCRFFRPFCAWVFVMKKYLIPLIVAASAAIQVNAAGLESQLQGHWQPDMEKTAALAKKADREMDPMTQAMMGKTVFEFQNDKVTVHPPVGMQSNEAPAEYKVTAVDNAANALTLSIDSKEVKVRFDKEQMAMFEEEGGWMVFNRMSKEDFAKRVPVGAEILVDGGGKAPAPGKVEDVSSDAIPGGSASGKVGGKEFKVDKAALDQSMSILELRHGEDMNLVIFLFENDKAFDGTNYKVPTKQDAGTPHIHMRYKVKGKDMTESEIFTSKYTMKLEFGTAKDGKIPGKIELRLPDKADSFVAGSFEAEMK